MIYISFMRFYICWSLWSYLIELFIEEFYSLNWIADGVSHVFHGPKYSYLGTMENMRNAIISMKLDSATQATESKIKKPSGEVSGAISTYRIDAMDMSPWIVRALE